MFFILYISTDSRAEKLRRSIKIAAQYATLLLLEDNFLPFELRLKIL